ncbi:MAG: S9 family peptidase, partial [Thermoflexibacter sp.]|nr:S9 family peptidase [Thermoflexibacter sp.]
DIFEKGTFRQQSVAGVNWMNDGKFYSAQEENDIVKYDVTTGQRVETIFKGADLNPSINFVGYELSADEKKILFMTGFESIYRRSFKANYYVYELSTKQLKELSKNGKQSYATFSPDGSKVAFCRDNNLFFADLQSVAETQITSDGKWNFTINGSADWVYEEEFGFSKAFFWSPDGQKIAFYTFDESKVREFNMQMWRNGKLYPDDYKFKYPKAGEANSEITISIYDLKSSKLTKVDIGSEKDIYIPRIKWTNDSNVLAVLRMNRLQNKLEILHANASTGASQAILTEESPQYLEADFFDDVTYLKDGKHFIYTSEKDGYKHLYLYDMTGKIVRQITTGNWEMVSFLGIDEKQKNPILYFTSTEVSPLERHFYSIDIQGKNKKKLSAEKGTNTPNISKDFKYYMLYHSNAQSPLRVTLWGTAKNTLIKELKNNNALLEKCKEYKVSLKEFFQFKTPDGTDLNGYLLKPANFDATKKYPVLMFVYGGPGSQQVADNWGGVSWFNLLNQAGYIVACVDNRGTGFRGATFRKVTYANLGKYEVQDQVDAAKYLGSMPYIDKSRIGIYGHSYGGYMSTLCLFLGADVFKAAIAGAPVTNWRYYDTIYTERYLKRPQDNADGYDKYSPVYHVDKLKGAYLIMHGTGDDNVHFQNAVALQEALIRAGKQFQSFYYPDRNHGIGGNNATMHRHQLMTDFVIKNL